MIALALVLLFGMIVVFWFVFPPFRKFLLVVGLIALFVSVVIGAWLWYDLRQKDQYREAPLAPTSNERPSLEEIFGN